MATETLNVNGVASKGSWTGTNADIFEAIASADNTGLSNAVGEGDTLDLDLDATTITDSDTVTNVSIVARAQAPTNSNDGLTFQILIGGTPQGVAVSFGSVPSSWGNSGTLNDVGWNSDWTAAQLNGMQVRVVTTQGGMPGNVDLGLDCLDVIVTYTAASGDVLIGELHSIEDGVTAQTAAKLNGLLQ